MARVAWGVWEHAPPPPPGNSEIWRLKNALLSIFRGIFLQKSQSWAKMKTRELPHLALLATALRICRIFSRLSSTNGITVFKYVIWDQFSRRSNLMYVVVWSVYLFKYLDSRFDQKLWPNAPERYSCFMYFKCQCLRPVMAAKRLIVV